ncbi:hypothetical protein [Myroides sp. WP-1]|uniref:hypothetical protein n=1 Tax=Myroides sp. WP-1 TaxID=2759944 RepID=UPI0015FD1503|nr:hypothetical protein [Myroides sp. WP-1]MBB1140018.1 hypothetical protein [Myroides sp. WP-1]
MKNYSYLNHRRNFIVFLLWFFSCNLLAQNVYLRISEKDCLNCYINIKQATKDKKVTYLFPENSKGNRFKIFNESFFDNAIDEKEVLFSDELYSKTSTVLNDLSGLVFIYNNEILFSEKGTDFTIEKVNCFFDAIHSFKKIGNLNTSGLSSRYTIRPDYFQSELIILDGMTQKLYCTADTIALKFDFQALNFDSIAKATLSEDDYQNFLNHKTILFNSGRRNINLVNLTSNKNKYYIGFFLPSILLDRKLNEQGETNDIYTIRNNYNYFILDRKDLNFPEKIYNSIYTFDFQNEHYYYTLDEALFTDKFYKLNQIIYSDSIDNNTPLFSAFRINSKKKRIEFQSYTDNISLFDFQKDEKLNTIEVIHSIQFSTFNNLLLLQDFPYIVNLENGDKIKLDWESNDFPKNRRCQNLQLWTTKDTNTILFKDDNTFLLKKYTPEFKLISTDKLLFNTHTKAVFFTEKYIYFLTETENVYRINNFI